MEYINDFKEYKIDVVVHLAGRIEAGISFNEPVEFYSVNSGGTCNLLKIMQRHGVKNIIFSSTAAVYKAQNRPIKERLRGIWNTLPYSIPKSLEKYMVKFVVCRLNSEINSNSLVL
jgi:UDP-glucose 4-epimerase